MWQSEYRKQLLDHLMNANLPDMLVYAEKSLLECPSALNFCTSSSGINEVCRDSDYILHCKLKSFMIRKNANVRITVSTEKDVHPVTMSIDMRCTDKDMNMFIIGMLYMAQRLGFKKPPSPISDEPKYLNLVTSVFGNRVQLDYDAASQEFAFMSSNVDDDEKDCQWVYAPPFSPTIDIPDFVSYVNLQNISQTDGATFFSKLLLDARRTELKMILSLLGFDALKIEDLYTTTTLTVNRSPSSQWLEYKYNFKP